VWLKDHGTADAVYLLSRRNITDSPALLKQIFLKEEVKANYPQSTYVRHSILVRFFSSNKKDMRALSFFLFLYFPFWRKIREAMYF